jgi:hypothetical protein
MRDDLGLQPSPLVAAGLGETGCEERNRLDLFVGALLDQLRHESSRYAADDIVHGAGNVLDAGVDLQSGHLTATRVNGVDLALEAGTQQTLEIPFPGCDRADAGYGHRRGTESRTQMCLTIHALSPYGQVSDINDGQSAPAASLRL